nr:PREDICTED: inner centromere protein A-like isoform X1 [Megachile rotundata]XP_012149155.1 PREDICTED: inner centromere protein A-like isoform X1 [Megachile rotundata]
MSYDNQNVPSNGKSLNSAISKRSRSVKSHEKASSKVITRNKALYLPKGKCTDNILKRSRGINEHSQNEITQEAQVKCKNHIESVDNENYDDPVAVLRKEIQDWRINELLTSRTDERFTETPSEYHSYSCVASGETTKRQRSPNSASKSHRTYVDYPVVTRKPNALEYLDLCENLPVPSLASCASKMHSQSSCDCYCKIRVPIEQQRKEIHSARKRVISSSKSSAKTEVIKSAKKVPLISARLVDDEELESRRSTITIPMSPTLSPETTVALENSERLIKDAEIQIKRINTVENVGRAQNYTWPDEASLDDENDQLLYIRERVAYKFEEANGWVDANRPIPKSLEFFNKNFQSRKTIDFSDRKFQPSEERYRQYLQQRNLRAQKLGFSVPIDVRSKEETKCSSETVPVNRESTKHTKMVTCSVQTVPSVDIKAELISQHLKSIHISPDASFERQNPNVGNYEIHHDFRPRKTCSVRKEKLTRIPTETSNTREKRRDSEFNGDSSTSVSNEISEKTTVKSPKERPGSEIQTETNVKSNLTNVDRKNDSKEEKSQSIPNISNDKQITAESKHEEKQVRFNDDALEESLELKFESFEISSTSKDEVIKCTPLSSEEIETRRLMNKRRHEEICGKRKREKEERYKVVDQRFSDVMKKYCNEEMNPSRNNSCSQNSSEDSDLSGLSLYEPCLNQFDDLLTTYNKLINNVVRSTETVDEFLSRHEYTDEFLKNKTEKIRTYYPRALRRKVSISKHRLSSANKNVNREKQRRTSSIKSLMFVKDNNSRKSFVVSKRSKFLRRNELGSVKNEESTDGDKIRGANDVEHSRSFKKHSTEKLPLFEVENDSSSFVSSSSNAQSQSVNERKIIQDQTTNLRGQKEERNELDHAVLCDVICSNVVKEILPKTNNVEHLREETLIEEKVKSFFNAEKIVPLLTKGLLENLRSNFLNFANIQSSRNEEMDDLKSKDSATEKLRKIDSELLENASDAKSREISSKNENSPTEEYNKTDSTKEISSAKSHEINSKSLKETSPMKCCETSPKNDDSSMQGIKKIDSESSKETSNTKSHEINSRSKNSSSEEINEIDSKFSKETSNTKSRETNSKSNSENILLKNSKENSAKEENSLQNLEEENNSCIDVLKDFDKDAGITEDAIQKDSTILIQNTVPEVQEENYARSIRDIEKDQISSSDSLRDCESIQSSKIVSKTSSNVIVPSRKINETVLEINNENEELNANNSRFDRLVERDKILSELYDDVHKVLFSSAFHRNDSTIFNQNWRSNSIPTVKSSITSSSSSHSEGELHMPSSGSYSIGEVRILTKNRSDEENTDDDITVFLTEQMLTSWNESSKALVQSMGEI